MAGSSESVGRNSDRALARDAALLRISRTRRWMFAGAAALTAGLAALASALLPGKSFGARSRTSSRPASSATASRSAVTPALPAPANAAQLGVQSAGQAPESVPAPAAAQPQAAPQPAAPAPQAAAPAPAPSGGAGGAVVSGGS